MTVTDTSPMWPGGLIVHESDAVAKAAAAQAAKPPKLKPLGFCVGQYDTTAVFMRDINAAASIDPKAHIRIDAVWRYCSDPTGTKFNFDALDAKINAVLALGLNVRLMVPMWCPDKVLAGKADKTQIKTASALGLFVNFCKALGEHLGTKVWGAATGNEPNLMKPFAPDGADPKWQATVTDAMVGVLPASWKLYTPGMAPAPDGGGYMTPLTYLRTYWPALSATTRARMHGVEIHPYGRASDVSQSWSVLGALGAIHTLTGKPIDASEYNSDYNDNDATKAINVPKGLDYMAGLGCVQRVFIYAMSDKSTDGNYHLGMYDGSGHQRPLYGTVAAWAKAHQALPA